MKIEDRLLGLNEAAVLPEDPDYRSYRRNIHCAEAGLTLGVVGIAGAIARTIGLEIPEAPEQLAIVAGATIAYFGWVAAGGQVMELNQRNT